MKEILYNYDNLISSEIDEKVVRTKALLINDNNKIILGYCNKTYQFPGGHLEEGESLNEGLIREVKEEVGIDISNYTIVPFQKITHYSKNYRSTGKNRQNDIYYFYIKCNESANMDNASLDAKEIEGNYTPCIISLDNVEQVLVNSIPDNTINAVIVEEMMEALKEFKKIYNK